MINLGKIRIRSSWNSDRVASCVAGKPHKARQPRKAYYFAQYCGNVVSVCGSRGKKRYTLVLESDIVAAAVRDGRLVVKTADACVREYEVVSGRLLSEQHPTPPAGCLDRLALRAAA